MFFGKILIAIILIFDHYYLSLQFNFDANRLRNVFIFLHRN